MKNRPLMMVIILYTVPQLSTASEKNSLHQRSCCFLSWCQLSALGHRNRERKQVNPTYDHSLMAGPLVHSSSANIPILAGPNSQFVSFGAITEIYEVPLEIYEVPLADQIPSPHPDRKRDEGT